MLTAVETGPAVVVCSTCRRSPVVGENDAGRHGGALLADALRSAKANNPAASVIAIQEMACLFACQRHCAVHIRAPGKIGYVLGDFIPDEGTARGILEYTLHYAASAEGEVRYADWPEAVKGHFITRTPPQGYVVS